MVGREKPQDLQGIRMFLLRTLVDERASVWIDVSRKK